MEIIIDPKSGFCFGVKNAILKAENEASKGEPVYCLGEIVHNSEEIGRLAGLGIRFIDRETYFTMKNCRVLIRAHGEPPETYEYARKNGITLVDATCPVVLKLQDKIKQIGDAIPDAQIVIYGKPDHPEVVGLRGQTQNTILIESIAGIDRIDFTKKVYLFAQTTKDKQSYLAIQEMIINKLEMEGLTAEDLVVSNSICGQVANRGPWLSTFSASVDCLIFVGGKSSSNSRILFEVCKKNNPNSFFITKVEELDNLMLKDFQKIGITGATSTPGWLIERVWEKLKLKGTGK